MDYLMAGLGNGRNFIKMGLSQNSYRFVILRNEATKDLFLSVFCNG